MANIYGLESCTFATDTIKGIVDQSVSFGGSANRFHADGNLYSIFHWVENIAPRVTVNTSFADIVNDLAAGDVGALVLEFGKRAAGDGGITAGSSIIATGNSGTMLGNIGSSLSHSGLSSVPLAFVGISADGTTNPIAMTVG